jgi:hypothetical protein
MKYFLQILPLLANARPKSGNGRFGYFFVYQGFDFCFFAGKFFDF